jgi:hypothetical protein
MPGSNLPHARASLLRLRDNPQLIVDAPPTTPFPTSQDLNMSV